MSAGLTEASFVDATERRRFELLVGGETAYADYRREPGTLVVSFVYAPPALRGTGVSDRLMTEVASVARAEGRRIRALCHYADYWLRSHKAHRDLLVS